MEMECKECGKEINGDVGIELATGCKSSCGGGPSKLAFPCASCGRLYWFDSGDPVFNRGGDRVFFEKGEIILKQRA